MKKLLIILIFVIFLIGCSKTPTGEVTKEIIKYQCQDGIIVDNIDLCEQHKCPVKKCEKVEEPYVSEESYIYQFKYGIIDDKTMGDVTTTTDNELNYITKQTTKIKNFEKKGGNFKIIHHYRTLDKTGEKTKSIYINAGETKSISTTFDTSLGEDVRVTTEVFPPEETRYKREIKYKTVERCDCS